MTTSSKAGRVMGSWLLALAIVAVGAVFLYIGVGKVGSASASKSWPTAQGEITRFSLETEIDSDDADKTRYTPNIVYRFKVEDTVYQGRRLRYGSKITTTNETRAREYRKQYAVGELVAVHYNPDDPQQSLLHPGLSLMVLLWPAIGVVVLLLGLGVLWRVIRVGSLWA